MMPQIEGLPAGLLSGVAAADSNAAPEETIDDVRKKLAAAEATVTNLREQLAQQQQTIAAFQLTIRVQAKVLAA